MIHLDTTFLVDLLREARRRGGPATAFLDSVAEQGLALSVHALCELHAISTMDLLIATSALVESAPLVTRNLGHFNRVPGLEVLSY